MFLNCPWSTRSCPESIWRPPKDPPGIPQGPPGSPKARSPQGPPGSPKDLPRIPKGPQRPPVPPSTSKRFPGDIPRTTRISQASGTSSGPTAFPILRNTTKTTSFQCFGRPGGIWRPPGDQGYHRDLQDLPRTFQEHPRDPQDLFQESPRDPSGTPRISKRTSQGSPRDPQNLSRTFQGFPRDIYTIYVICTPPTCSACGLPNTIRFERCESQAIRKRNDSKATIRNSEAKPSGQRSEVIRKRSDSNAKRSKSEDVSLSISNS